MNNIKWKLDVIGVDASTTTGNVLREGPYKGRIVRIKYFNDAKEVYPNGIYVAEILTDSGWMPLHKAPVPNMGVKDSTKFALKKTVDAMFE